jgi:hypothetical protein
MRVKKDIVILLSCRSESFDITPSSKWKYSFSCLNFSIRRNWMKICWSCNLPPICLSTEDFRMQQTLSFGNVAFCERLHSVLADSVLLEIIHMHSKPHNCWGVQPFVIYQILNRAPTSLISKTYSHQMLNCVWVFVWDMDTIYTAEPMAYVRRISTPYGSQSTLHPKCWYKWMKSEHYCDCEFNEKSYNARTGRWNLVAISRRRERVAMSGYPRPFKRRKNIVFINSLSSCETTSSFFCWDSVSRY